MSGSSTDGRLSIRWASRVAQWYRTHLPMQETQEVMGSIPGLGRSPGEGNGKSLQLSCLESPTHRGAWWATVPGDAKSRTRLSTHIHQIVIHFPA